MKMKKIAEDLRGRVFASTVFPRGDGESLRMIRVRAD